MKGRQRDGGTMVRYVLGRGWWDVAELNLEGGGNGMILQLLFSTYFVMHLY